MDSGDINHRAVFFNNVFVIAEQATIALVANNQLKRTETVF